ncbi:hypothetical protein [Cytophaga sp. FL35]|uniref:hypothetical protein n=1 Tax=Cytophaga sp. FL35 TaxID=1904456 RepID=UPI0016538772|nr:hypothetical protein [Cytophaga sp. FL35]MBC6998384.1 hypothetical protein [Cytophaga sp. FL35]
MNKFCLKYFTILIGLLLITCDKDPNTDMESDSEEPKIEFEIETGAIVGDVTLFDMSNNKSTEYDGTIIKLFKEDNLVQETSLSVKGTFSLENLEVGSYKMVTEKEGYGTYDTIQFNNTTKIDTLSTIKLLEYPTVEPTIVFFEYGNYSFGETIHLHFKNDEWLLAGKEYYFSRTPDVSFQKFDYRLGSGSYRGGNKVSSSPYNGYVVDSPSSIWSGTGKSLENGGFTPGEKIYVRVYVVHEKFYESIGAIDKNFEVISHIRKNGSNVYEFQF